MPDPNRSSARPLRFALILAAAALAPHAASAQSVAAPDQQAAPVDDTIRLSDEQRDLILDRNTLDSAAAARGEMSGSQKSELRIHGEVGAMIGSNGSRAIFGRADIPLGENAGATVMFEHSRFDYRRR